MGKGLRVTIIGAGLAGTITGRVLREQHDVTILEKFPAGHELGAAINIGPCAVKILLDLGFDRVRAGSITAELARTFDRHGNKLQESDMAAFAKMADAPWFFQHRADLWNEFHRLATAEDIGVKGKPCKVIWGADVVDVDVESGDVTLADGTKIESDLVVGADGIKSIVRPLVVGDADFTTARPSGSSAYRFTIPTEAVKDIVDPRVIDSTKPASLDVHLALDVSNRSIVMYPCRDYKLLNFVCIAPDANIKAKTTESWSATGSQEDLLETFEGFSHCKKLLEHAENIKLWQLRDQDPLPTYIKGRTVLIGDAAHAMTPHQGQGGTQAVEDAEGFRLFNSGDIDRDGVHAILEDFDRVRRQRASQIQNHTREAHARKSAETLYKHTKYNWTYPGIHEALARLNAGKEMIEI